MDQLDLIRKTHEIERGLARLVVALSDEQLKKEILAIQDRWRELGHQVTAEFCGLASDSPQPVRRRGRPRKRLDALSDPAGSPDSTPGDDR